MSQCLTCGLEEPAHSYICLRLYHLEVRLAQLEEKLKQTQKEHVRDFFMAIEKAAPEKGTA